MVRADYFVWKFQLRGGLYTRKKAKPDTPGTPVKERAEGNFRAVDG